MDFTRKTDSYKASHFKQFPPNTEQTFYYAGSRGGAKQIVPFGPQAIIKKHFLGSPTLEQVKKSAKFWKLHGLPFNEKGWSDIARLGYLPLEINSVPEGRLIDTGRPMVTVTNTGGKNFFWLPGWVETILMQMWYPTTVATISRECKVAINKCLEETGDPAGLMFKLHDFGYRGATCQEAAGIGGMAHLVNFMGTDTIAGILAAQEYYGPEDEMFGFSIPAAEHSTITAWGQEFELQAYENMLDQFATPGALVAVVSDSYNMNNAVNQMWGKDLKKKVIDSEAMIVIRPDSGDPVDMVRRTVNQLDYHYGSVVNEKGFKVLNNVRVIQGDGIDRFEIPKILKVLKDDGFSADNLAFGMGAGLLQKCDRDTYKFAMKCSAIKVDGEWRDVFKNPVDAPWKASKGGRFEEYKDLKPIFRNGKLLVDDNFQTIRNRAW